MTSIHLLIALLLCTNLLHITAQSASSDSSDSVVTSEPNSQSDDDIDTNDGTEEPEPTDSIFESSDELGNATSSDDYFNATSSDSSSISESFDDFGNATSSDDNSNSTSSDELVEQEDDDGNSSEDSSEGSPSESEEPIEDSTDVINNDVDDGRADGKGSIGGDNGTLNSNNDGNTQLGWIIGIIFIIISTLTVGGIIAMCYFKKWNGFMVNKLNAMEMMQLEEGNEDESNDTNIKGTNGTNSTLMNNYDGINDLIEIDIHDENDV